MRRYQYTAAVILPGLLALGCFVSLASSARAAEVDGTVFESNITVNGTHLHLAGTALLRYLLVIKAYAGALYLPPGLNGRQALSDIPKQLVLEYRVGIAARDFAKATADSIKSFVDNDTYEQLETRIEALNSLYVDVIPGDRYSLTYLPGSGTELALNKKSLGNIHGADFAAAVFSIWIGEKPIDAGFRDKLLGVKR